MEPKARNIPNKLIEMFRALQLEHTYSKSEILTFYFNMLPYGGNIVGTAAASRFYFNKPQHTLSLGEAALLAAIPNAPERLRPDRFPENARKARERVPESSPCTSPNLRTAVAGGSPRTDSSQTPSTAIQSTPSLTPVG